MQVSEVGYGLSYPEKTYKICDIFCDESVGYYQAFEIIKESIEIDKEYYAVIDGKGKLFANVHALNALLVFANQNKHDSWYFINTKFSDEFFDILIMNMSTYVKALQFEFCQLREGNISQLHNIENLECLSLCRTKLDGNLWETFLNEVKSLKKLKYFKLEGIDLDKKKMKSLKDALKNNMSLEILILDNNQINNQGAKQIAKLLNHTSINFLNLNSNRISDVGLARLLISDQNLKHLSMRKNLLGKNSPIFLRVCPNEIETLDVSSNSKLEVHKIVKLFKDGTLKRLRVEDIPIDKEKFLSEVKRQKHQGNADIHLTVPLRDHQFISEQLKMHGLSLVSDTIKMVDSYEEITDQLLDIVFSDDQESKEKAFLLLIEKQFEFLSIEHEVSLFHAVARSASFHLMISGDELKKRCLKHLGKMAHDYFIAPKEINTPEYVLSMQIFPAVLKEIDEKQYYIEIFDASERPKLQDAKLIGKAYGNKNFTPLYLYRYEDTFWGLKRKEEDEDVE